MSSNLAQVNEQSLLLGVPAIRRGFRLQFEPAQGCHVLLYPEGMIKLNESAGEILKLVDGRRSVATIIAELQSRFPEVPGLDEDILAFLEVAHAQFWIELR
jgi:pyrroloquinoline quinone biosynthesis protein D